MSGSKFARPSVPLITSLHEWMQQTLAKVSRKSDIAGAIGYALGRWPALLRYCNDGLLEIDNNAAERALRAAAIGRKNYLSPGLTRAVNVPRPCTA
jgi:transposase